MSAISSWTAVAVRNLSTSKPILEHEYAGELYKFYLIDDSLWLIPESAHGQMAFRIAFFSADQASVSEINQGNDKINFQFNLESCIYTVNVQFYGGEQRIFRYASTVEPKFPMLIPYWPKDMLPLSSNGKIQAEGIIHTTQVGARSALMYLSMKKPNIGSVFYFQNLSALNPFFKATETSGRELVGGSWPEIGFALPTTCEKPLPAGEKFVVSDAFVCITAQSVEKDTEICEGFLNHLAAIYLLLPKIETRYHEWRDTAAISLKGLADHKGCWTFGGGHPYLNAYLCDYKTPPEIMVQMAVLLPLLEYCDWQGESHAITDHLIKGLPAFYSEDLNTVVRWLPALKDNLDNSEEQKQENVMDSWYLHHPLMNLTRLAIRGDKKAKELLSNSLDFCITVAQHFKYEWPVFYDMETLKVIKAETQPGKGGEKDVPGAYAKLMMEVWEYTKDAKYLREAKKAVESLKGLNFDVFYQANNTAFSAVSLLRLYKHTKEQKYLDLSYACLASIFKNVQLWSCEYGYAEHYPTYFAVYPLSDAPYTAAYEEQEVYATLYGYLQEASGIEILPSIRLLIAEFIKHAITRMPYYFPSLLPKEVLSEQVKTGEIDRGLYIPLEDIHDGWEQSGEVGQEVYGACLAFGVVPRQYIKIPDSDMVVFIDYPITDITIRKNASLQFKVLGDERQHCQMLIFEYKKMKNLSVSVFHPSSPKKGELLNPQKEDKGCISFELKGDSLIKIKW